jgi:Flp pilus assembly protein TadD
MPTSGLMGIPHTAQVDHRILRRPTAENRSALELPLVLFKSGAREIPQVEQDRAWGIVLARIAQIKSDPESAREALEKLTRVRTSMSDDIEVLEWLGVCKQILGQNENARSDWSQILKTHPHDEGALKRLADQAISEKKLPTAKDTLVRYLETSPWDGKYWMRLASIEGSLGEIDAASRHAKEALDVNPTLPGAHGILAEVYKMQGNLKEAQWHQRLYQRLELLK